VLTREDLPDWLLSFGYWARRSFFLRRREYPLIPQEHGWFRLDDGGTGFPHKRVAVTPHLGSEWTLLEFEGHFALPLSELVWRVWLERPPDDGSLEFELPFGLVGLSVKVSPPPDPSFGNQLEIREIGLLADAPATMKNALGPGTRLALSRARETTGPLARRARVFLPALRDAKDVFQYARWFRAFQIPSTAGAERLRSRALSSGLRFSIVLSADDERSTSDLEQQLPGQVQVCRSLSQATGDVVVPLEAGVELAGHALATVARVLAEDQEAAIVYADDDRVDSAGQHSHPSFKPVWSPELIRARNVLRGLVAIRRALIPAGFEGTLNPANRYALILACSEDLPAHRIRRIPVVLASLRAPPAPDLSAEQWVVAEHLKRLGIKAQVEQGLAPGLRRIRYVVPNPPPRVSIIVPTRNAHSLLETCVRSVRRLTAYPHYEIILVDNGSDDPRALASFEALANAGLVRLLRDPRPFNYAAINNDAIRQVSSELVCMLNNDIEVTDADWLEEMVTLAVQPGVGAVGAKLLYPNGTVQHGGVLLGFYGAADHAYVGVPSDAPGYDQQLLTRREVSAVTAACLVVRRALYEEVGGLDAIHFPVGFNDVDLCLKLRGRGLRNVWTPHARLIHHESATRGRDLTTAQRARAEGEIAALRALWRTELLEDPFHSPNLALKSRIPRLAWPPRGRRPWSA
jgi:GT2 family glycosyltransferase